MDTNSVQDAINKGSGSIRLHGWVYRERRSKDIAFIVLRDSSNIIQCVVKQANVSSDSWDSASKVLVEASVEVSGEIHEDKRAPTGYEVNVKEFKLIGFADKYPITKDQSTELLLDNRHLWLRSRKMTAILKIRSTVFWAIHEYFRSNGFYEFHSPSFTSTAAEGGTTLFEVKYFGSKMYLTQTWQLYAEAGIFALEKIYTIAPSFRAEKSKTSRHLTEYWHAEVEAAWLRFDSLLELAEGLIKHIIKAVLEKNSSELKLLERDSSKLQPSLDKKFKIITYDDALRLLNEKKKMRTEWGKDLRTIEEEKLMELFDAPVFVTHYPKKIKAFYMLEDNNNKDVVLGVDLLAPEGYGELIGGSERETDPERLILRLKEQGENPEHYSWYLDLRRFGSVPHSGFGMGVERVISWICGLDNIKDAIPFPRTMLRTRP